MKILNLLEIHSDVYSVFTGLTLFDTSKIYVAEFFSSFWSFSIYGTKLGKMIKISGDKCLTS